MSSRTLEAIVIRHRPYGEADVLVSFLTKDEGLLTAFARSMRKMKSRKAAALSLFSKVRVQLHQGKGSLPLIREASVLKTYPCLQSDLNCFSASHLMAECILSLSKENEPMPKSYQALKGCLKAMDEGKDPIYVWCVFAIKLLHEHGLMTLSRDCHKCQKNYPGKEMFLIKSRAEIVCKKCAEYDNLLLSDRTLKILCGIPHLNFKQVWKLDVSVSDVSILKELLKFLMPYHLEKELKSFELFGVL